MALFFHSYEVDHLISLKEAVQIAEEALRDVGRGEGITAPSVRFRVHPNSAEKPYDTVLTSYAGGSQACGAIGARVAVVWRRRAGVTAVEAALQSSADRADIDLRCG